MEASTAASASAASGASQYLSMVKHAFSEWSEHKATKLAAALAFYTMLSIAPLLIISIKVVGSIADRIYGKGTAAKQVQVYLTETVGKEGANAAKTMISAATTEGSGILATIVSGVVLLFAASGVFGELQDSLNTIFEVKPKPNRGIMGIIKDRFFSLTLVLGTAFLLLVSLIASTVLTGVTRSIGGQGFVFEAINFVVSIAVVGLLFALMFKYLPDVKLQWRNALVGGALTAVLFTIGKFVLGWYLGRASTTSIYGAFGSLVALLLWVYYSAQILFFGAEFTRAYALAHGDGKQPEANAVKVTEEDKAKEGRPSEGRLAAKVAQAEKRSAPRRPAPRRGVPSPAIPGYRMATAGAGNGGGKLRQIALAGAGAVVGALAGGLGAMAMRQETKRPTRKHLAAVQLDERLRNIEQKCGNLSRIHQYMREASVHERVNEVEQRIRHARTALRADASHRPKWLVQLGDKIAGNRN